MELPVELRAALDRVLERSSTAGLGPIAEQQSAAYRTRPPSGYSVPLIASEEDALAYAAWRMPATYAAIAAALDATGARLPEFAPRTQLDLGSGPGTAIWAAWARTGSLDRAVGLEQAPAFRALAERLVTPPAADAPGLPPAQWHAADLASNAPWTALGGDARFDLVTVCYVAGEIADAARARLVERAWARCAGVLLVVEPGTSAGYARLMAVRATLIELGAHVAAPCPHADPCPLGPDDWCHFSERVARSRAHRRVKGADLGYEDEKYAYLAACRTPPSGPPGARVLRRPSVHKAAVELTACTPEGLETISIRRREKADYQRARKLRDGHAWPWQAPRDPKRHAHEPGGDGS